MLFLQAVDVQSNEVAAARRRRSVDSDVAEQVAEGVAEDILAEEASRELAMGSAPEVSMHTPDTADTDTGHRAKPYH